LGADHAQDNQIQSLSCWFIRLIEKISCQTDLLW